MATVAESGSGERFEIGRVINLTFSTIGANPVLFLGLGLVIAGIPQAIMRLYLYGATQPGLTMSREEAMANNPMLNGNGAGMFAFIFATMLLTALLHAALTRATIEDLSDRKPSFGDAMGTALRLVLPTIAISILVAFGAGLGMILLIVPGIVLWLGWAVAIPVLVQERRGVFGSMSRSRELTKGSRWSLFGLFIVAMIIAWVIAAILGLIGGLLAAAIGTVGIAVAAAIGGAIGGVVMATAAAVSYVELRRVKEGADVDELAEVFA